MHDGAASLNKDKHQACGMKFADENVCYDNAIDSSFRKPVSHESDKVAHLAEEFCQECFKLDFQYSFSSSV